MADSPSSPANIEQNSKQPESDNPFIQPDQSSTALPPQEQQSATPNPNSNQVSLPSPIQSHVPPQPVSVPPTAPSYRPVTMPAVPQFSPVQNFQNTAVQPPGVGVSGSVAVTMAPPMMPYHVVPGQLPNPALRPYAPVPNGYGVVHAPALGLPRYPAPYPAMVRPVFPPRPPGPIGVIPAVARPPVPGIPGVRPIITPVIRPAGFPVGTPAEKPETTVYVGKIASTADNDFMLSLLQVCGPVKSWKRPQHPSNGTLKGFGFCEFESAEGVLRALRLLSKFNVDGQELMLNVTQATKDYLERYVEKKTENTKKLKETHEDGAEKEDASVQGVEKKESPKASEDLKDSETGDKENHDYSNFGIVTDEDREMDQEGSKKLKSMIEERLKANPLPPPPSQSAVDDSGVSHSEVPAKNRDGDSDVDILRNDVAADKIEDETASDSKATSEHERPETSSPDRRTYDRRSRDRDRERDLKREKEREIDRYEREAERERVRKEREQRRKIEDAEREYERCLKDWEYREREKEKERQYEKERAKERERKRKKEILYDEEDEDDDSRKRWRRSVLEDKKRKRLREKEDDFMDKIKEEEEIAEAKKRAEEEQLQQHQRDALKLLSGHEVNGTKKPALAEEYGVETKDKTAVEQDYVGDSINEKHLAGDEVLQNGTGEESMNASVSALDMRQSSNTLARKLGFGLVGSGKRAAVPSVFHEEEDDDAQKEKKMRPLVPIDYSTEELQAAQPIVSGANQPNLAAAAEFAKHISNVNSKEEKLDSERERSRRSHDRSGQREKDRSGEDNWRTRDENKGKILDRDRDREHGLDKVKTPDNKKLLDAKQLIDMIPKTKEELFSHEINWAVYDEHELHERMRPWISKKITEFLGEEETTLVDYIVSSTQEHVKASQMLELLQTILDDEAEMFVLKMWRMLIFEIKKVETGLAVRSRS